MTQKRWPNLHPSQALADGLARPGVPCSRASTEAQLSPGSPGPAPGGAPGCCSEQSVGPRPASKRRVRLLARDPRACVAVQ